MKVFLSYGGLADQVTALRLQALAAVNGLTAFVPPAYTRQTPGALLDPTVTPRINDADIVLCVIGSVLSEACRQEINAALALQKPVIVMADPMSASRLEPYFGPNLVVVDPANPRGRGTGDCRTSQVDKRSRKCKESASGPRHDRPWVAHLCPARLGWRAMRAARCTIDTSSVIALDALGLLPTLSFLFSRVLLPKAVRSELFRRRATKDRLRGLLRENAFLQRCDDYDKGAVDTLLAGRSGKPKADRGEAEAVVQAAHAGAVTIVDDPWGRSLARSYDLEFHGTLWVLRRLWELQLRAASALREDVITLQRRGTRLPDAEVNDLLKEMGQAPLADAD